MGVGGQRLAPATLLPIKSPDTPQWAPGRSGLEWRRYDLNAPSGVLTLDLPAWLIFDKGILNKINMQTVLRHFVYVW